MTMSAWHALRMPPFLCIALMLMNFKSADAAGEGQITLRGSSSESRFSSDPLRKLQGSCGGDSGCVVLNTINTIEQQVMLNQQITKDFLLVAVGVDVNVTRERMLDAMDDFESVLSDLSNGDAAKDIKTPPSQVAADFTELSGLWTTYKTFLARDVLVVNSGSLSIFEELEPQSDAITAKLEYILDKYMGYADLEGIALPPSSVVYAKNQLRYISRMMIESLYIGLNYKQGHYMESLLLTQRLFQDAQTSLVYGNQVAGIPELTKMCTLHGMLAVDAKWGYFQEYLKQIKQNQVFATLFVQDHTALILAEIAKPVLVTALTQFKAAWDSYADTDAARLSGLQDDYIFNNPNPTGSKDILDYAMGSQAYHSVHKKYHPIYRDTLYQNNYYDIFIFDLEGNLIYTVYKELDYATNFDAAGTGEWKDSGLGEAFRAAMDRPDEVHVIDWKPYGPSAGALASFLSHGVRNSAGQLIGVFSTQLPPEAKPVLASVELLAGVETSRKTFAESMEGALELFKTDDGSCDPSATISNTEWTNILEEFSRQRMLAQKVSRIYFQFATGVNVEAAKVSLEETVTQATNSMRSCMKGSYADGIPAPSSQTLVDQLKSVWADWQLFVELVEYSYKADDVTSHGLAQIETLSKSLFDDMSRIADALVLDVHAKKPALRSIVREVSQRQLTLLQKMAKEATLVTLDVTGSEDEHAVGVETGEANQEAFKLSSSVFRASHWDLLQGRTAQSVVSDSISSAYVLEPVLFMDQDMPRTTDACTLTIMVSVLDGYEKLNAVLRKLSDSGTNTTDVIQAWIAQVNGLVDTASDSMSTAVGYYKEGSATCSTVLSKTQWEVNLDAAGQLPYLFQKAQTEFYLLASGLSKIWMDRAIEYLQNHEGYILEEASQPQLVDAFVAFRNGWNTFRPSDAERRLGLQVAYITLNPHPAGSKDILDYAEGTEEYHVAHKEFHPIYRDILYARNYYDIFMLDLNGNLIYSVYKELDYATNFAADGTGEYKDSGLGEAFEAAMAEPEKIHVIDWKPYGPSAGALASFLSTGIRDAAGVMIGVFSTQMPPESKPIDSQVLLDEALVSINAFFNNFKFGNPGANIRPPATQTIANRIFTVADQWDIISPHISGAQNDDATSEIASRDATFARDAGRLLQSVADAAWAADESLDSTKITVASQQLARLQKMCRESVLLSMGNFGASRASLAETIREYKDTSILLIDGGNLRRLQGNQNYVSTTENKDLLGLLSSVQSAWETLQPTVEDIAGGAQPTEPILRTTVEDTSSAVKAMAEALEFQATTTRTTTMLVLEILAPMPLTGDWAAGGTMRVASLLAESLINEEQMILPGFQLKTVFFDDKCDSTTNSQILLREMSSKDTYIAFGGAGCSQVCESSAFVAKTINLPFLSYECPSASLSDTIAYPDLTRFGTITTGAADVIKEVTEQFGWNKLTIISGDPSKYGAEVTQMTDLFVEKGLAVDSVYAFETDFDMIVSMMADLQAAMKGMNRVFYFVGPEKFFRKVVCASILAKNRPGITWLSRGTWRHEWWKKSDAVTQFNIQWLVEDVAGSNLRMMLSDFMAGWNSYEVALATEEGREPTDEERREALQEIYVTDDKEMFEGVDDPAAYHVAHKKWHAMYRQILIDRSYYDIFVFDMRGNLVYSVYKEADYATNFAENGVGKYKESGLGDAYRAALANPDNVTYIDWKPYAPSAGALAAFLSTGIRNEDGELIGVYSIQLPPEYEVSIEELQPECTLEAIAENFEGAINIAGLGKPTQANIEKPLDCFKGHSASSFLALLDEHLLGGFPLGNMATKVADPYYAIRAHAADATCAIAFTVRHLLDQGHDITSIQKPDVSLYSEFVRYLKEQTDFQGASGRVKFEANDKPNYLAVQQVQQGSNVEVGLVDLEGEIEWTPGALVNASWTQEFQDPPAEEAYFPWFVFQIIAPLLVICVPILCGLYMAFKAATKRN